MFVNILIFLFIISFLMAIRSARKLNEKPSVKSVKRSADKDKIIAHSSLR